MLEPTSGSVTVEGLDNRMHIQDVRRILGFCPQYGEIERYNTEMNNFYGYFRYSLYWIICWRTPRIDGKGMQEINKCVVD